MNPIVSSKFICLPETKLTLKLLLFLLSGCCCQCLKQQILTFSLLFLHYCIHKCRFTNISVPDQSYYRNFRGFLLTLIISNVSQSQLLIDTLTAFGLLVLDASSFNLQLWLALAWHCLSCSSLFGTDDLHVDFLSLHQVTIKDVQIWGVSWTLSDQSGF